MKTFTKLNEHCISSDVNPGNALNCLGVTNHLTPVSNIVMNVRNFFASQLGVVATIAEDGFSVKLNSSKFVNKEEINKLLNNPIQRNMSLKEYIQSQGLNLIKMVNLGQYWVVYFSPSDIKAAMPGLEADQAEKPVKEQVELGLEEVEMYTESNVKLNEDEDTEMEDSNKAEFEKILAMSDLVKAAKKIEAIVSKEMELPREFYFAAVKSVKGTESIALRWKYTKRCGKKETTELTKSLFNMYKNGEIFVADFDEDSMFNLPTEVNSLINNVLELFNAEKTNDKAIYKIKDFEEGKKDDKKEDDKKDDEKKDKKDSDKGGGLL